MKKSKLLWSLMALPLLAACSHDDLVNSGPTSGNIPEGEGVYMTVNFTPFQGTRSYTEGNNSSNEDPEVGTADENEVKKVLIVLATTGNSYIASATVDNEKNLSSTEDKTIYQAKAKFSKTAINAFYELDDVKKYIEDNASAENPNPPVNVYIYCNPPTKLLDKFKAMDAPAYVPPTPGSEASWENFTISEEINTLWGVSGFPMTNVEKATRYFPASFSTWNNFSTENNPFDLSGINNQGTNLEVNNGAGAIKVHRMAARFDFRDGSQWMVGTGDSAHPIGNGIYGEEFTYGVMKNSEDKVLVKAKIINMSLVNMLNEEYYLERVCAGTASSDWTTPFYSNTDEDGKVSTGGYTLLGAEKPWFSINEGTVTNITGGNYVVTPKAANRGTGLTSGFSTYYQYPFFSASGVVASRGGGWFTTPVANLYNTHPDSLKKYPLDVNYHGDYHRWRYVTENTIAGGADGQVNSSSTGVVFKAQLLPGDGLKEATGATDYWNYQLYRTLNNTESNGPVLYSFSGNLYCSWKHIQYAALKSAGYDETKGDNQDLDRSATLFKAVFGNGGTGVITFNLNNGSEKTYAEYVVNEGGEVTTTLVAQDQTAPNYLHSQLPDHDGDNPQTSGDEWEDFRDAVVNATFTIYEKYGDTVGSSTTWGYYCYYYYWNRHNDNGQNGVMAPMEFAVVRNNVYKLAVTSLNTLGHPRIPENDPDSPKPDTPDEKSDLYMTVSVQVVPWVVRINNIEF